MGGGGAVQAADENEPGGSPDHTGDDRGAEQVPGGSADDNGPGGNPDHAGGDQGGEQVPSGRDHAKEYEISVDRDGTPTYGIDTVEP